MFTSLKTIFHRKNKAQPGDLLFDTTHNAFVHACKYTNASVFLNKPILAFVIEARDDGSFPVKVARSMTSSKEGGYVCLQPTFDRGIGELQRGDLVLYQPTAESVARGLPYAEGAIIDKVQPVFRPTENRWLSALQ